MIAAIVVFYYPSKDEAERLLSSLANEVDVVFGIDNTPGSASTTPVFLEASQVPVSYIPLGENKGIAEAQNIGIELSVRGGYSHVLLLDQDSALSPGMVAKLLAAEGKLLSRGEKIAGISPQIVDGRTGKRPCGCHYKWYGAERVFRDISATELVKTDAIMASGSLIRTSILQTIGGMRDDLFIDHVDTEWAMRAHAAGYAHYCVPNAVLMHSLGETATSILGRDIYLHGNIRYYYRLRNEIYLFRLKTMGWQWRAYIAPVIFFHFVLYFAFSDDRIRAFRLLLKAISDGVRGRLGPIVLPSDAH